MHVLGHASVGHGRRTLIVMNDWLCDTSTWDTARPYLDTRELTWVFADLRGYGRSREMRGDYDLLEAAADVLALADALGADRFTIVGHSMSSLVALRLAQEAPARVSRAVVITPPPPQGFGADETALAGMHALARTDDEKRLAWWLSRLDGRLSAQWARHKVERWRATSDVEAFAAYAAMFARDGLPPSASRITCPVLAVTGEHDAEVMRRESVTRLLTPLCDSLTVQALTDSGHYPMQEMPPRLVNVIERFVTAGG